MSSFLDWFNFCVHQWRTTRKYQSQSWSSNTAVRPSKVFTIIEQVCDKCGEEVVRRFRA